MLLCKLSYMGRACVGCPVPPVVFQCRLQKLKFLQWHSSVGLLQVSFSSGVPVYPAGIRWVAQWYPSVHWVNQCHSNVHWTSQCTLAQGKGNNIQLMTNPQDVYMFHPRGHSCPLSILGWHYCHVIMGVVASQITSLTIVYSTVYSDADQRKHQSFASLAFVRGIHRGPVNSPHKWPVTLKWFHLMTSSWDFSVLYRMELSFQETITLCLPHTHLAQWPMGDLNVSFI